MRLFLFNLFLCQLAVVCFGYALPVSKHDHRNHTYTLSLIHFNDFHARFEETSPTSTKCNPSQAPCIGGIPRLYSAISDLIDLRPDSVVVNAGDSFQGTLWFNLLKWNVTQYFMNLFPLDAHTLGNHEFDNGISGVVPYMKALNAPMVACNIDASEEPSMQGLFKPSIVIERQGRKIGIIGVVLKTFNEIANTEKLKFTDEVTAVKKEAEKLAASGINIIIVLSHCGIEVDRDIARNGGPNIDIIVGGHSHSLLYTGKPPSNDVAVGDYPIRVQQPSGNEVLVVQASAYTKYLGDLIIDFGCEGAIKNYTGIPIYLSNSIEQDAEMLELMEPIKEEVDKLGKREVGFTKVLLKKSNCLYEECNLGSFLNDAFVDNMIQHAETGYWTYAAASLMNQGGIRNSIEMGPILYEDLVIAQPFANYLNSFEIKGKHLMEAFEYSVTKSYSEDQFAGPNMLQVSGFRLTFNVTKPVGQRVVSALIRCAKCDVPSYSVIQPEEVYRIVAPSFITRGGDGFVAISDNAINIKTWEVDIDILENYVRKQSPIMQGVDGRIAMQK